MSAKSTWGNSGSTWGNSDWSNSYSSNIISGQHSSSCGAGKGGVGGSGLIGKRDHKTCSGCQRDRSHAPFGINNTGDGVRTLLSAAALGSIVGSLYEKK